MRLLGLLVAMTTALCAVSAHAEDNAWRVGKVSGDVMLVARSSAPVTMSNDAVINPGDSIRTGRNGRLLLVRGEETILVSPNSAISIPQAQKEGLSTTIAQQAGSILLKVEKRNVRNFEVETPYLAAVVKGTQFSVTVDSAGARVDVREGSVEVADMKTGQFALVLPGQAARVGARSTAGLVLSGAGQLNAIQRGEPRPSNVAPLDGSKAALKGPQLASANASARIGGSNATGGARIMAPIGAVTLDIKAVTRGMARGASDGSSSDDRSDKNNKTVWNSSGPQPGAPAAAAINNGGGGSNGGGNGGSASNGGGPGSSNGNANGNGNGDDNGNGNAYGHGKGKGKGKS